MITLPGSVVWLFLLVYLASSQILDISSLNISDSGLGNVERADNITNIQRNDEQKKGNATAVDNGDDKRSEFLISDVSKSRKPEDGVDRGRRRGAVTYGTVNPSNVTQIPMMSPERRNSYLSIAERRKYYNRTRVATTRRPDSESEHQETPQANEIRVSKKPVAKDRKEEATNQRLSLNTGINDTQAKLQSTRQSVIQSQYQFGQKLKPGLRSQQEGQDKRKKEKSKQESTMENSTNKRNYPTQSTKLIRVDKPLWVTTTVPNADVENFVVNETGKLAEYVTANNSQLEVVHPASVVDNRVTENGNETKVPQPETFHPLPLNYENGTTEGKEDTQIQHVYNQEIFKINGSSAIVFSSPGNSDPRMLNVTKLSNPTTESVSSLLNSTVDSAILNETGENKMAAATTPSNRSGKFSNYEGPATSVPRAPTTLKSNVINDRVQSTTPLVRVIPKAAISPSKFKPPPSEKFQPKGKPVESWSSTEEYPLTIELNENNKRILSEMFLTSTPPTEPKKKEKPRPTTSKTSTSERPEMTSSTTEKPSSTTPEPSTTTTESAQVLLPDDFPEDHKAQGTRFNTKFYIAPNLNRTQVIRVVENEDDDDDDIPGRPVGVAVYVLAAFGLVPLLLALAFAAKFIVQRHQRQYDCESDAKSDLSAGESQPRQGRRKKGSTELKKSPSNVTTTTLVTTTRLPRIHHWDGPEKQPNKNWEFPRPKLKLKTILGQGNFGQVWKAEAEDMGGHEGVTRLVAVKTVKEGATDKEHAEFKKELEIMQQIGSHPNIVTLLGCCTDQEPYYLIMEYVKYGKLLTYLREHRINENYYNFSDNLDALTSRDLTVFAYCVARGMEYLASRGIIHRDLAARNVLVDHTKLCKIADFGMSRSVRDFEDGQVYEERQHKGALPIRWMAPESLVYSVFTYKSDVWSFGIVMWEIVTLGSTPYPNLGAREVMRMVRDGYRLERPSHCKPEFFRLISHCWAHDPNKRPDFSELRHELSNLLDNPTKDGSYVDLDRFAVNNSFHIPSKPNELRLLERTDFKSLKRVGNWAADSWPEEVKKARPKKGGRNNGKGTVTLTGQGSFTVNSRILEKEFKMI